MPQAFNRELLVYADDTCLIFQHKDIKEIEIQHNKNFSLICDWFVDNKLSLNFREDKTESILFSSESKVTKVKRQKKIKQYSKITCLGCIVGETV